MQLTNEWTQLGPLDVRVPVEITRGKILVKTANTSEELRRALALRHDVFFAEGLGRHLPQGLDIDEYDRDSDHLIAIESDTGLVVGNYRLRSSLFHRNFYTETEFNLEGLLNDPFTTKLEIGRACVHRDYRRGPVIQALWAGIFDYALQTNARYVFGCSSVPIHPTGRVDHVWDYILKNDRLHPRFQAAPRHPYRLLPTRGEQPAEWPLLAFYLKMGACVLGPPALDLEFECADFPTLLDVELVPKPYLRRLGVCPRQSS